MYTTVTYQWAERGPEGSAKRISKGNPPLWKRLGMNWREPIGGGNHEENQTLDVRSRVVEAMLPGKRANDGKKSGPEKDREKRGFTSIHHLRG